MPPATDPVELGPLPMAAAGELLTLQRAAHVTEAQLYDDVHMPALTQTLDQLRDELARADCIAARLGDRLVGAVRRYEADGRVHIGRLVVVPDLQGRGIGSRLLTAAETGATAPLATLFTGHLSQANLRLYRRHGYTESARVTMRPGLDLVHLTKILRPRDGGHIPPL